MKKTCCCRFTIFLVASFMTLLVGSCAPPKPRYYIGFVNKTEVNLSNVSAYYGDQKVALAGGVVDKGRAVEGPLSLPIPSEAEVRWDEAGTSHRVKAKLEGVVPKGFTEGTIYFILKKGGTIEVKAIKLDDVDANASVTQ